MNMIVLGQNTEWLTIVKILNCPNSTGNLLNKHWCFYAIIFLVEITFSKTFTAMGKFIYVKSERQGSRNCWLLPRPSPFSFLTTQLCQSFSSLCIAVCFSGQPCSREAVAIGLHECPLQVVGWDMDRHRLFQASDVVWVGRKLLERFPPS